MLSSRQLAPGTSTIGRWSTAFRTDFALLLLSLAITLPAQAQTNAFPEFRPEKAREYWNSLTETIKADVGTNAEGYFCLARLQSQLGEKGEAERLARKALERQPGRSEISLFLADMLVREDRMQDAADCLRDALQKDPRTKGAYRRLGMVLERQGDKEGARKAFDSAVKQEPGDASGWLLRGKSLLEDGKLPEAVSDLEQACKLDPTSANPYYPLFQAQTRLGNRDAAAAALAKFKELKKIETAGIGVLTDQPADSEDGLRAFTAGVHRATAAVLSAEGNLQLAKEHLRQAIRIAPNQPDTHELLARICVQQGLLPEARTNLAEVVRLRPNSAADRVNLGVLLLQLRESDAAVAELKRALELDPKRPEALQNLARFYLTSRRDLPEALTLSQRLVEADPSAASYDLLGWACYANDKTNEAIAATAEAVKKEPGNAVYASRLRRLQQIAGAR